MCMNFKRPLIDHKQKYIMLKETQLQIAKVFTHYTVHDSRDGTMQLVNPYKERAFNSTVDITPILYALYNLYMLFQITLQYLHLSFKKFD